MSSQLTISELRKKQYDILKKRFPHAFEWKWYSYRRYKLKLYIEAGCFLAYWFIKLRIKANYITATYALMGLSGGILLAISSKITIFVACSFYFFRGILDGADGIVARETKQASINGTVFDSYAAHIGWISLWTGMGIYLGHSTHWIFYYLSVVIPALFALDLHSNAIDTFIVHRLLQKFSVMDSNLILKQKNITDSKKIRNIKNVVDKIFEHNARTLDSIVLMILFETFTSYRIVWVFFSCFLVWQAIIFTIRFYMIVHGGWAEKELANLQKTLNIKP